MDATEADTGDAPSTPAAAGAAATAAPHSTGGGATGGAARGPAAGPETDLGTTDLEKNTDLQTDAAGSAPNGDRGAGPGGPPDGDPRGATTAPRGGAPGDTGPHGDAGDPSEVVGSLSPSRAGDFMTCPLLYRFRVIDRIPERPSPAAVRGTLVHAVLERLFDLPAARRTPDSALALLDPEWERLRAAEPELAELFGDDDAQGAWMEEARAMLRRYFTLEDPRRLEPARREFYVETTLGSGLLLRGYIDRLDVAPTGEIRVVDYKTGASPSEMFEARALFQMKFYALVLWRLRGTVPRLLQLIYLGNGEILAYAPDEADLRATERKVEALWRAITRAMETGDWRPRRSRACAWCDHKERCPEFGGTPPPLPPTDLSAANAARYDRRGGRTGSAAGPGEGGGAPAPRRAGDDR